MRFDILPNPNGITSCGIKGTPKIIPYKLLEKWEIAKDMLKKADGEMFEEYLRICKKIDEE